MKAAEPNTRALNRVIGQLNTRGGEITVLAAAPTGTATSCDLLETRVMSVLRDGTPPADLAPQSLARLAAGDRHVQRDGQPVTNPPEALGLVSTAVERMLANRREIWRRTSTLP